MCCIRYFQTTLYGIVPVLHPVYMNPGSFRIDWKKKPCVILIKRIEIVRTKQTEIWYAIVLKPE